MRAKRLAISFCALILAVGLALPGAAWSLSPRQIADRSLGSIVKVLIKTHRGTSQGSGFAIGPDLIVTNYHVVRGAQAGRVKLPADGRLFVVKSLVIANSRLDLAVLRVTGLKLRPLPLGDSNAIRPGDEIFVISAPRGLEGTVSTGTASLSKELKGRRLLQFSAPISPGSSGGPLLNDQGQVVGVVTFLIKGGQNLNFAVPVSALLPMMAKAGIQAGSSTGGGRGGIRGGMRGGMGGGSDRGGALSLPDLQARANDGDVVAQTRLGTMLLEGRGAGRNLKRGLALLGRAAGQGYADAQFKLGEAYLLGKGVRHDPARAFDWIFKAASQGVPQAQFLMGEFFSKGLVVQKDRAEAVIWYNKAKSRGHRGAQKRLKELGMEW